MPTTVGAILLFLGTFTCAILWATHKPRHGAHPQAHAKDEHKHL